VLEEFETTDGRGTGVRARRTILKRSIVLEYKGKLLSKAEALKAEDFYEGRGDVACYTFWIRGKAGEKLCLDATHSAHISKFINHSKKHPNLLPVLVYADEEKEDGGGGRPRIMFKAMHNIPAGAELLFDYRENRPTVLEANPWLKE
jgi:SET domain-containing protein